MDPAVEAFGAVIGGMSLQKPSIPIVSTATGAMLTDDEAVSTSYWQSHLRKPVRFADALTTLLSHGACAMLELGPGSTLTGLALRQAGDEHAFAATLDAKGMSESDAVMLALGRLWVRGASIPWAEMFANETRTRLSLPTYPFRKERHWVDPERSVTTPTPAPTQAPTTTNAEIESLIESQLELMARQLAILAASGPDEPE
jgi:acyl transferase domain-containing protein